MTGEVPMERKTIALLVLPILVVATLILAPVAAATSAKVTLGAKLYFDATLSEPSGQACADCHQPFAGYADPDQGAAGVGGRHRGSLRRAERPQRRVHGQESGAAARTPTGSGSAAPSGTVARAAGPTASRSSSRPRGRS